MIQTKTKFISTLSFFNRFDIRSIVGVFFADSDVFPGVVTVAWFCPTASISANKNSVSTSDSDLFSNVARLAPRFELFILSMKGILSCTLKLLGWVQPISAHYLMEKFISIHGCQSAFVSSMVSG